VIPKICVSILPRTCGEAVRLVEKAGVGAPDFVEVRLDHIGDVCNFAELRRICRVPLIAANRSVDYGGVYPGSERQRLQILIEAARKGVDYVDVELSAPGLKDVIREALRINVKRIVSSHDFDGTRGMEELEETLEKEIATGADVCKIVTTARSVTDNLRVLEFTSRASQKAGIVCFSMGQLGKPSRLLSPIFGALFTIASLDGGNGTAPGQLTLQEARAAYKALGFV